MSEPRRTAGDGLDLAPTLRAASLGDPGAWREIVERYGRRVYALAKSRCGNGDVAEELTQSVFATVATKVRGGEYAERGRFESWLFRVTMNRVRDFARRQRHRAVSLEGTPDRPAPGARDGDPAMLARLRAAMATLSDADRDVIELRHHGQLTFRQIADLLEEPLGTLLARHHRALHKLKELIGTADAGRERPSATIETARATRTKGATT